MKKFGILFFICGFLGLMFAKVVLSASFGFSNIIMGISSIFISIGFLTGGYSIFSSSPKKWEQKTILITLGASFIFIGYLLFISLRDVVLSDSLIAAGELDGKGLIISKQLSIFLILLLTLHIFSFFFFTRSKIREKFNN